MTSMNFRTVIAERIEQRFAERYRDCDMEPDGACLYWALVTIEILHEVKRKAYLQGGTLFWPRTIPDQDDGMATVFGYQWDPDSAMTRERLAAGLLPEMHMWVALPADKELIDMTTRYLVNRACELEKSTWTAPAPPRYLWMHYRRLPLGVLYQPYEDAYRVALAFAAKEKRRLAIGGLMVNLDPLAGKIRQVVAERRDNEFQIEDRR